MKDFLGNELSVGSEVVCIWRYNPGFTKGVVERFTPQKVVVEVNKYNVKTICIDPKYVTRVGGQ